MKLGKTCENAEKFNFKATPEDDKNKEAKIMKISVNSWHYKLVRLLCGYSVPSNFCSYARWLLFALFLAVFTAAALSYFVYGWVVFAMNFPEHGWELMGDTEKYLKFFEEGALMLAVMLTGLIAFFSVLVGVIWGIKAIIDFRAEAKARRWCKRAEKHAMTFVSKKPKEPGLVRQWLKAKKEKVCPRIEYTEE